MIENPDTKDRVIIIAEAGVNHNGDFDRAVEMIHAAKLAGADYVKFQTAVPELVISSIAPKAEYQKETTGEGESQLDMCRKIHLRLEDYAPLKKLCDEVGIGFLSTPFDLVSIDCLDALGMDYWKIPSGEITNLPYLRKIGEKGERVILSTGMSELHEIDAALRVLEQAGTLRSNVMLLHCNTQYPTPMEDVNLRSMEALSTLGTGSIGYSDHTVGIEVPVAAVALGAKVIEKHFTLDKSLPGPDHKASQMCIRDRTIKPRLSLPNLPLWSGRFVTSNVPWETGRSMFRRQNGRISKWREKASLPHAIFQRGKCFPLKISL